MKANISYSCTVCLSLIFLLSTAQGTYIGLSNYSSEAPSIPASWLDARMDFSVVDDGNWKLTVQAKNWTPENEGDITFNISELYFNTTADITNMTLDSVLNGNKDDWTLTFNTDGIQVGGLGLFDISLKSNNPTIEYIESHEYLRFTIIIEGVSPSYLATDFITLSSPSGESLVAYGAGKFFGGGPGDLSAYGAYIPEPGTILMLSLGALALVRKRNK